MPHFRTFDNIYYDFHEAEDDAFDFKTDGDTSGNVDENDFLIWQAQPGSSDTSSDPNEPGLAGVTISLDWDMNDTTTTTFEDDFII